MQQILQMKNIPDREKWELYNRSLLKYLNYAKILKTDSSDNTPHLNSTSIENTLNRSAQYPEYMPYCTATDHDAISMSESDDEPLPTSTPDKFVNKLRRNHFVNRLSDILNITEKKSKKLLV